MVQPDLSDHSSLAGAELHPSSYYA